MFCPNCGVEYRPGFTRCNDCDVDLVNELPSEEAGPEQAAGPPAASLELLWRGTQAGVFHLIAGALDDAGLHYNREKLDARLTFSSGYAPLELWVPAAELAAARAVLDDTLARIAQPIPTAAAPLTAGDEGESFGEMPGTVQDPFPEDATAQVWWGAEQELAEFLKSALAANGIGCCIDASNTAGIALRVLPECESQAREIVRQVVDGIAPE